MINITKIRNAYQFSLLQNLPQSLSRKFALAVIIIGLVVILGWCFDIGIFKSLFPGLVTMKANTAIAFVFSGISLLLWHQTPTNSQIRYWLIKGAATITLLIGLLTVTQYIFGINLGIDQLFFKDSVNAVATASPGRMAINTAINFVLVGMALLLLSKRRQNYLLTQLIALVSFLIAFLGCLGYLYGNSYFYRLGYGFTAMAIHTSIAFMLLTLGILLAKSDRALMSVITSSHAGGLMAQRLYPALIVISPLVSWLILLGYRLQIYTADLGICLLGVLNVVIFGIVIWFNAGNLNNMDKRRYQAEHSLKQAYAELEEKVTERTKELRYINEHLKVEIAERQQVEKALQNLAQELQTKNDEMNQTLHELKSTQIQLVHSEKMSSLGQLVAGVAHEINNPVNFIYGNITHAKEYVQSLLDVLEIYQANAPHLSEKIEEELDVDELDYIISDFPRLLGSMSVGVERIREIVLALRNFSRMDEAEIKEVNIHEGIESTLLILQNRLKPKSEVPVVQVIKIYDELPLVECYPGPLNQVFMNILANAIDALEEFNHSRTIAEIKDDPSFIKITTEIADHNCITIRIIDNGPGIKPENISKLFDPFFTTKPVGKGTGLGLSISYQIITEKHHGSLICNSTLGAGTEFIITIPVKQNWNLHKGS